MILDDNSKFGLRALTRAIGSIQATPTQIRDLELFKPVYLSDTKVDIERQDTTLKLVQAKPRNGGTPDTVPVKNRNIRTFRIPHLPVHDSVLAEDVQGLRAFGTTEAETVMAKVEAKLADGKQNLEYTREHLMLGALLGKILDADGSEIYDIYQEFGLTRTTYDMKLSTETTEVGRQIDEALAKQRSALRGAAVTGWVALCGFEFIEALKYHQSVKPLYERWREGAAYREADGINPIEFVHNGIRFIHYTGNFGKAKLDDDKAILLPTGPGRLYEEYFAPANYTETVNTVALPYYAKREPMKFGKGYDLEMQSNPLPLVLRPDLVATLTA